MKLEKSFTINGYVVDEEFQREGIKVYSRREGVDLMHLYFIDSKSERVLFEQKIEADCNQNVGYISTMYFKEVK